MSMAKQCKRCGGSHPNRGCKVPFMRGFNGFHAANGSWMEIETDLSPDMAKELHAFLLRAVKQDE
jgi:hypothetical protein